MGICRRILSGLSLWNVVLLALIVFYATAEDVIVQLPKGKIRGHVLESESGKPYYGFQDVPYGAPPVGVLRLQLPKEPEPWSGILDATNNTVICYQGASVHGLILSEDCLYLNVYTPVVPGSSERLPVLVWIHGGSFSMGSGAFLYNSPKYFMDHGIVIVSINYRLGPFGFLSTNDDVIPANLGLKDQLLALEWVNENIELFGGNPSQVTISGESAGSMSVAMHLMGPWPKGKVLFHAAILESGSLLFVGRSNNARETAFKVAPRIDISFVSNDTRDLLKLFQRASAEYFLKVAPAPWPFVETTGPYSYHPMDCYANGNLKQIPILIGFTSEEFILSAILPNLKDSALDLDNHIWAMVGDQFNISLEDRTTAGHLLRNAYTNTTFQDNLGAYIRFKSDYIMGTPITKQAELHSKYNDVYLYQFSYKGQMGGLFLVPPIPGIDQVGHTEELKYLWDDTTNSDLSKFPAEDVVMLHRMVKMWTNFVKYHNPTPEKDPLLENIIWKKVETGTVNYMNINVTMENDLNPRYYDKVIKAMDSFLSPELII